MTEKLILPCIRSVMGDWVFYSTTMSIAEASKRIITDKKYRENPELDKILQRDLKPRKEKIARYLQENDSRFFNSIIIGVWGGLPQWHEFEINAKLEELGADDENFAPVGLLEFVGNEEMFAIDGQHRVAGMQIAYEREMNKPINERVLLDDRFPVILVAHIDDNLGRKRTRKLFSDINNNAAPVAQGDRIKINEEDLSAIVTRRIYAEYKYFQNGKLISLTESEKLAPADLKSFTNLLGLNNAHKELKGLSAKVRNTNSWDEVNVINFYGVVEKFYDTIINTVDEYNEYFITKKLTLEKARENNKYILFRPVGLKLLAKLYAFFMKRYKGDVNVFTLAIKKLNFIMPKSPLNKVLWNDGVMDVGSGNQPLAYKLCLYLLDEPTDNDDELLSKYRKVLKDDTAELPAKLIKQKS